MLFTARLGCSAALILALSGCGLTYSALPEVWDRLDPDATYHMEVQVKHAIYCELKRAAIDARDLPWHDRLQYSTKVSTEADRPFPDNWGVLITLTLQADEKSALTPGLSLKTPLHNAPVNFRGETIGATGLLAAITYGPASIAQSYSLGLGGTLSSQNIRYDKYNFYYTARDLTEPFTAGSSCITGVPHILGPKSTSSPFVDASNLGIHEWLLSAIRVIDFHRSSRAAANDEGDPLGGATSDSSGYDNKFVIVSDATISPTWNLVRIGTPSSPLFDANRTRVHELLMTVGPGTFKLEKTARGKQILLTAGPSASARDSHLASQIGSAVANAIRAQ
jgi:hypothetical protein